MGKFSNLLHKMASLHVATVLLVEVTLWLTLAPKPLGDDPPPLFPGADKLAHALMFMAICGASLYEQKLLGRLRTRTIVINAIATALFGLLTEIGQALLNQGRAFEWGDIAADATGAFLAAALIFLRYRNHLSSNPPTI